MQVILTQGTAEDLYPHPQRNLRGGALSRHYLVKIQKTFIEHERVSMQITFNGEIIQIESRLTLSELLNRRGLDSKTGIAVAVNSEVVKRSEWERMAIKNEDEILVITAAQGG